MLNGECAVSITYAQQYVVLLLHGGYVLVEYVLILLISH